MSRPAVVLSVLVLLLAGAACGGNSSTSAPGGGRPAPGGGTAATTSSDDNQIRLTAAESTRLVRWLETFRSCMLERAVALGPLEKNETQIRMALPTSVVVSDLLTKTESCGEAQGGPPHRSSLQYRPGEIVLYLPKRCLLDKKVAAS
jgi:hypothetical protein